MTLPSPPRVYTPAIEADRNRALELADNKSLKRDQDIELVNGARVILRASDGSRWKLVVSTTGVLTCEAMP